jgi:hypothetical protein
VEPPTAAGGEGEEQRESDAPGGCAHGLDGAVVALALIVWEFVIHT